MDNRFIRVASGYILPTIGGLMDGEQFKDLYILVVKPYTTWEGDINSGMNYVLPLTPTKGSNLSIDGEDMEELTRLKVMLLPTGAKKFEMKNGTDKNQSYIIINAEEQV